MAMSLRPVTEADKAMVCAWRNDPESLWCAYFHEPVTEEANAAWFATRLNEHRTGRRSFLIAEIDGEPVAQLTVTKREAHQEVGYMVSPNHRGRGIGTMAIATVLGTFPGLPWRINVRLGHGKSLNVFKKNGFIQTGTNQQWIELFRAA